MQTFLPYSCFQKTARALDSKRLGKQRIEAWQVLMVLVGKRFENGKLVPAVHPGSAMHPCAQQWRGYTSMLLKYTVTMVEEWRRRGFSNTRMDLYIEAFYNDVDCTTELLVTEGRVPPWLGDRAYHMSHKASLLRKAPEYYSKFKWRVPDPAVPYVWPSQTQEKVNA